MTDMHLGELFEIIGVYFGKITGGDLIMESIDKLGGIIATFISEEKPKGYRSKLLNIFVNLYSILLLKIVNHGFIFSLQVEKYIRTIKRITILLHAYFASSFHAHGCYSLPV